MFAGSEFLFAELQHHVLTYSNNRTENTAVVSRDHQHNHHCAEKSEHTFGQHIAQSHRQQLLVIQSAEFGKNGVTGIFVPGSKFELFLTDFEVTGIKIVFIGNQFILRHDLHRHLVQCTVDLRTDLGIIHNFSRHTVCELQTDIVGFLSKFAVIEHHQHGYGDQHIENRPQGTTPSSKQTCHFLFVRRTRRRRRGPCPDPAGTVQHSHHQRQHQERKDVEVTQVFNIAGIEEAFAIHPVGQHRQHVLRPVELDQNKDRKDNQHRVADEPLHSIGDDDRHRTAHTDNADSHNQHQQRQSVEGGNLHTKEFKSLGPAQKVDKESRRQSGHDHIGKHFRYTAQSRRKNTEITAVTHFEELTDTLRLGFAEAVGHKAVQPHNNRKRSKQCAPERGGKTGTVMDFHITHQTGHRKTGSHVTYADNVTAADTTCGEKRGNVTQITPRVHPHKVDKQHWDRNDYPVIPLHHNLHILPFIF